MAGGSTRAEPGLYAGRRAADHSNYSDLHLVELLRVPRQSAAWRGVSLMKQTFLNRLIWMLLIWGGSVMALFAVSMVFRLLMSAAGFKSH
ncbi:Hypothetical protein AKI40_3218 [Enterobacter sp. FY-07]|nr:Hypothetical protein AKI40_3218 [Enterobacter sp. FY-07]